MTALSVRGLQKYFGNSHIIRGLDLEVEKGERHAIIGPNGAGKSTMFHLISGLHTPDEGEVLLHGEPIQGLPSYQINRRGLGRSFQVTNLFHELSVIDNLRCALLWNMGCGYSMWRLISRQKQLNNRAEEIVEQLGLTHRRDTQVSLLSYAEQRTLEIGATAAGGGDVILLDEPTAGMSRTESDKAVELMREISEGKSLLVVEHDMSVVFNLADRISVLVYGQIIATDTPENIRSNKAVQEAYLGAMEEEEC